MNHSLKCGRLLGIDLFIHWSFWLLPIFAYLNSCLIYDRTQANLNLCVILAMSVCVVMHEFGHALAARSFGIETHLIKLYAFGGVAWMKSHAERPWHEFAIAAAGPLMNVGIASILAAILIALRLPFEFEMIAEPVFAQFVVRLFWVNVAIVFLNLLPALPMDGGRMLLAFLSTQMSRYDATKWAILSGIIVAVLLGIAGVVVFEQPMIVLIAIMLIVFTRKELAFARQRHYEQMYETVPIVRVTPIENASPIPDSVDTMGNSGR